MCFLAAAKSRAARWDSTRRPVLRAATRPLLVDLGAQDPGLPPVDCRPGQLRPPTGDPPRRDRFPGPRDRGTAHRPRRQHGPPARWSPMAHLRPRSAPVPSRRRHPRWNVDDHPRLTRANPPSGSIPHHPVAGTAVAPPETLCARITAAAPRSTVSRSGPSRSWASSTHPWRAVPRTDGPFPGPSSRERWGSPIRRRWR